MTKKRFKFSSPIGESTFSTGVLKTWHTNKTVFVPYRGIYFLYEENRYVQITDYLFSSPIGESTFSTQDRN